MKISACNIFCTFLKLILKSKSTGATILTAMIRKEKSLDEQKPQSDENIKKDTNETTEPKKQSLG